MSISLAGVHDRLLAHYGQQQWWPAEDDFEVMVGAVLTQNTSWTNVEKAIAALREAGLLSATALLECDPQVLAGLLRPVGYFNVKTKRLRNFCGWYRQQGGEVGMAGQATDALREGLLAVNGVGPETADDILLYALRRPVFVIDTYTRRLFGRLGLLDPDAGYETLRSEFERQLDGEVGLYSEYHALIVQHGKDVCRARPRCDGCLLAVDCPAALG